jgi:ubiquinone/menaquinone biosynthesis C-methylase UbiE
MGRIAQRKLQRRGSPAVLVRGRAQQLPFADAAFDAVVSTFPTDFIVAPETLREIARVLPAGGQLIIVPNGILTAGGATTAALEWLYRVTGQRGATVMDISDFFEPYGLEARMTKEPCPRSSAQVIVAQKGLA